MTNTLCGDATCTEQGPWPHPLVGHVTGDMKRRESNETLYWTVAVLSSGADAPLVVDVLSPMSPDMSD